MLSLLSGRSFFFFFLSFFYYTPLHQAQQRTTENNTAQQSTAQHSAKPAQAAKHVRADQSATTQTSRQSWLEPACRRAFIMQQLVVFYTSAVVETKKSKSAGSTRKKIYNNSRSSLAGMMYEGFACTPFFLSVLSISSMHGASGFLSWTMELLAFANRQFAP